MSFLDLNRKFKTNPGPKSVYDTFQTKVGRCGRIAKALPLAPGAPTALGDGAPLTTISATGLESKSALNIVSHGVTVKNEKFVVCALSN